MAVSRFCSWFQNQKCLPRYCLFERELYLLDDSHPMSSDHGRDSLGLNAPCFAQSLSTPNCSYVSSLTYFLFWSQNVQSSKNESSFQVLCHILTAYMETNELALANTVTPVLDLLLNLRFSSNGLYPSALPLHHRSYSLIVFSDPASTINTKALSLGGEKKANFLPLHGWTTRKEESVSIDQIGNQRTSSSFVFLRIEVIRVQV